MKAKIKVFDKIYSPYIKIETKTKTITRILGEVVGYSYRHCPLYGEYEFRINSFGGEESVQLTLSECKRVAKILESTYKGGDNHVEDN